MEGRLSPAAGFEHLAVSFGYSLDSAPSPPSSCSVGRWI